MDIKNLERATKVLMEIKGLDAQILQIDKFAMMVANQDTKTSFELTVEDLTKKKEDDEKVEFDGDGSIILPGNINRINGLMGLTWMSYPSGRVEETKINPNVHTFKPEISPNCTMSILGILLREKTEQRERLIGKLNKMGFSL